MYHCPPPLPITNTHFNFQFPFWHLHHFLSRIKHQRVSFVALLSFGTLELLDHRAWMSVFLQMAFLFPVSVYADLKGCATVLLALTLKVAPTSCNYFLKSLLNVPNLSCYTNCLRCFSHFYMLTHSLKISFNPSLVARVFFFP